MSKPIPYNEVKIVDKDTIKFGDPVLDEFLSANGGVELATMIALSGTSGAGKTTLCKKLQRDFVGVSLFYALESLKGSVARQTKRIKTSEKELIADSETFPTWSSFMDYINSEKPTLVIVDSLQHAAELMSLENEKHKYDNYKNIIKDLYTWKDKTQGVVILIVQLNGEGKIEGPASTVFNVDCPIFLIADPKTGERFMETEKNRMGPTGKIYYEFADTDECIKFFTEVDYELKKSNLSLPKFINKSIEAFVSAISKHKNYPKFRKELVSEYNKIHASGESEIKITADTLLLIDRLMHHFE